MVKRFLSRRVKVKSVSEYYFLMDSMEKLREIIELTNANMIDYLYSARNELKNITKEEFLADYDFKNDPISVAIISWFSPVPGQTNSRYIVDFGSMMIVDRYRYLAMFPENKQKLRKMGWGVVNDTPEELKDKLVSIWKHSGCILYHLL